MWRAFPFLFLTSVALAACGGGGDEPATRNATLPTTTTISPTT
ncbi:MAG TPA: redoxin, partial [Acidimicrobiaceae bacterium]|nr:redoxin [Acidimicrobiaceae bacterium]